MTERELDFETHLEKYRMMFGYSSDQVPDYVQKRAQEQHALIVSDALRDFALGAIPLSSNLTNSEASYYMLHGAVRRLMMVWNSYRTITSTAPPDREEPLSADEQSTLSRDINVIYMHIRGIMDNFAWCFLYEKEPEIVNALQHSDISLFSRKIRKKTHMPEFWREINGHSAWAQEVKARRDPVAHRIPLYIPNSALTEDEATEYQKLDNERGNAENEEDFDQSDMFHEKMYRIGHFLPCFLHHPEAGTVPIYPTLPCDMVHLVRLGQIVERHIR